MNFSEAIQCLEDGVSVRRKCWGSDYIYLCSEAQSIFNNHGEFTELYVEYDLFDDEWEIVSLFRDGLYQVDNSFCIRYDDKWYMEAGDIWLHMHRWQDYDPYIIDESARKQSTACIFVGNFDPENYVIENDQFIQKRHVVEDLSPLRRKF